MKMKEIRELLSGLRILLLISAIGLFVWVFLSEYWNLSLDTMSSFSLCFIIPMFFFLGCHCTLEMIYDNIVEEKFPELKGKIWFRLSKEQKKIIDEMEVYHIE